MERHLMSHSDNVEEYCKETPGLDPEERYEPDDSLEVIDTRPGRPVPKGRWDKRPRPLLHATHTLCDPSDNWPVSLELIVLTGAREDDHTATEEDLPQLQLAGWEVHEIGPLKLYTRITVA
jgi:hypothetical protein